jgi:hypothetical protein
MVFLKRGITRRAFNATIGATLVSQMLPLKNFSSCSINASKDGLLHYTDQGQLEIYSGVGHSSLYSSENPVSLFKRKLKISEDQCRFMIGRNPPQLPALLAGHINHLSFSTLATNEKAIEVLEEEVTKFGANLDDILARKRIEIFEDGISLKTCYMTNQIKGNGVIVAVKEVI